jgi:hypothetical protein
MASENDKAVGCGCLVGGGLLLVIELIIAAVVILLMNAFK